jgi:two-component system, NarL family, sensor kinase
MLATAAGAVRVSIRGLRSLLVDIYPPSLTTAGLVPALTDLTEVLAARDIATLISHVSTVIVIEPSRQASTPGLAPVLRA